MKIEEILNNIEVGINANCLSYEEEMLLEGLEKIKAVYKKHFKDKVIYKLCGNVKMIYENEEVIVEVTPNSYMGVFFENEDLFECNSKQKRIPKHYCIAYALNPNDKDIRNFYLGNEVKVKVIARGYDSNNEGLLVELPNSEKEFFKMEGKTFITLGVSKNGKSKNTGLLNFKEPVKNVFISGKKGLCVEDYICYNYNKLKMESQRYVVRRDNGYKIIKLNNKLNKK